MIMEFDIFEVNDNYIYFFEHYVEQYVENDFIKMPYDDLIFDVNYKKKQITLTRLSTQKKYILIPNKFEKMNYFLQLDKRINLVKNTQ